jgi:hypothetical protein
MEILFTLMVLCQSVTLAYPQIQPPIRLDIAKAIETTGECKLSSIADEIRYVPLEAKKESFIENIEQYAISNDLILIADKKVGKVMKFDRTGHYLGDMMVKGKGPKEFIQIDGLDFNSRGEILVLKDGSAINIYSENGDLLKGFHYYGYSTGRWLTDDKILLVMDYLVSAGKVLVILDKNGKELAVPLKTPLDLSAASMRTHYRISSCAEGYYYFDALFDTVYTINKKGEVYPRCVFLHRKDHVTQKEMLTTSVKGPPLSVSSDLAISGQKYEILNYFDYKDKILLSGSVARNNTVFEFDKRTGTGISCGKSIYYGLINDLDKGPEFFPVTVLSDGSAAKFLRTQYDLIHYIDWVFPKSGQVEKGSYDINLFQKLADYGNPVLMMVK